MATKRSTYLFSNEEDFNQAKKHLYHLMYEDYNDSDKIYFYGSWGSCYEFNWDECFSY